MVGSMNAPVDGCTLAELARRLNRPVVQLRQWQERFDLPVFVGAGYSPAYAAFLRGLVMLRIMGIGEEVLVRLWKLERRLLKRLHADSTGSPTWFLDSCGRSGHRGRRLLLSNHDLGMPLPSRSLQLGLNFADSLPELFAGREMGEDVLRLLEECIKLTGKIRASLDAERPLVREALRWSGPMASNPRK